MWNTGHITAHTLYWNADGNEWRNISEVALGEPPSDVVESVAIPEATTPAKAAVLSSKERQDLYKRRSNAFVVDLLIGAPFFVALIYFASSLDEVALWTLFLAGSAYVLFKDSLPKGQSVGKRFYKIQTVQLRPPRTCGPLRSVARNAILWGLILGPWLIGAVVITILKAAGVGGIVVGIICGGVVVLLLSQLNRTRDHPCGQTLADEWSGTQVVRLR